MNFLTHKNTRRAAVAVLALGAGAAQAHTGHGAHTLFEGLSHPLGADHLLAMAAVGVWSVQALPQGKTWQGPAAFMLALVVSATLGAMGLGLPFLEQAIALSVAMFGALLVLSAVPSFKLPAGAGLAVVAAAASLHGLAHGAEAPAGGVSAFAGYAMGFLLSTAALHMGGVSIGMAVRRFAAKRSNQVMALMGTALGGAGLALFQQL